MDAIINPDSDGTENRIDEHRASKSTGQGQARTRTVGGSSLISGVSKDRSSPRPTDTLTQALEVTTDG